MKSLHRRWLPIAALATPLLLYGSICLASLPSTIPFKPNSESDDNLIYRALGAFLVAAAFAYGIAWCIKRYMPAFEKRLGRAGADRELERLETMRLNARSTLLRVRWGNQELLLGENEHGVTLLAERPLGTVVEYAMPLPEASKENHE